MQYDLDTPLTLEELRVKPHNYNKEICDNCTLFYARKVLRNVQCYANLEHYCQRICTQTIPVEDIATVTPISVETILLVDAAWEHAKTSAIERSVEEIEQRVFNFEKDALGLQRDTTSLLSLLTSDATS